MDAKIENGRISMNIHDLFDRLTDNELLDLAEALAVTDEVIRRVMQQVLDGGTEDGSHAGESTDPFGEYLTPLSAARLRIAEESHILAREQIEMMRRHMAWREECHKKTSDWAWKMYHDWPVEFIRRRPELPR